MEYENVSKIKAQMIIDAFITKLIDPNYFRKSETYQSVLNQCKLETILFLEWITEIKEE